MLRADRLQVVLDADEGLVTAIDGLQLAIERGETFALVGESGCGKSTTALALMRLLPDNGRITQGDVELDGIDLLVLPEARMRTVRGRCIGMIFQEPATSLNPVLRLGEQIVEAIETHTPLRGSAARAKAIEWLVRVGIADAARRFDDYPFRLSGGQKQRVMIAMVLAAQPDFLIADEPTTALDMPTQAQILDLLQDLQRERRMGLLLITHDLGVVARMADRVALMYAGQIVEVAPAADFFARPLHPYARRLLQALPHRGQRGKRLAAIPGNVPKAGEIVVGCRFAPRCALAIERCRAADPPLEPASTLHAVRCVRFREGVTTAPVEQPALPLPSAASGTPLLQVERLSVRFAQRKGVLQRVHGVFTAVDGVSFEVRAGHTLALVGASGCGKTTIGKAVVQLLRGRALLEGRVLLHGENLFELHGTALRTARRAVQIVFQDPFASLDPRMRTDDSLEEGLLALRPELDATARRIAIEQAVDQVGIERAALARFPHEFSGGQRQRIAIARALAVRPELIVCDEPTSALDVSVQAQILNLLRELQRELGVAYLFITHNMSVVEVLADDIAVMDAGRIVESGPADAILERPQHRVTRELLAAARAIEIGGDPAPAGPVRL
jgi:peptide/nickel transport system ATP-binding protein